VEVQGTAEGKVFERSEMDAMIDLAQAASVKIAALQNAAIKQGLSL
jgi:ribonuclease PH